MVLMLIAFSFRPTNHGKDLKPVHTAWGHMSITGALNIGDCNILSRSTPWVHDCRSLLPRTHGIILAGIQGWPALAIC